MMKLVAAGCDCVQVGCNDADIFVQFMHYCHAHNIRLTGIMEPTTPHTVPVYIGYMVKMHLAIVPSLIEAHALTGCDTVGAYFGKGKVKAVKVLETGYQFHSILQNRHGTWGNHQGGDILYWSLFVTEFGCKDGKERGMHSAKTTIFTSVFTGI